MKYCILTVSLITLIFSTVTLANPIPVPSLIMPEEFIRIHILGFEDNRLKVRVEGEYPFKNVNFNTVKMYFPIPYNVKWDTVKVCIDDRQVEWKKATGSMKPLWARILLSSGISGLYQINLRSK